jgi:hypothetical protein
MPWQVYKTAILKVNFSYPVYNYHLPVTATGTGSYFFIRYFVE